MYDEAIDTDFNDRTIRIIMVPFFGVVIPNIVGLIDNSLASGKQLTFQYLYLIFISFTIWHGNRYLVLRLRVRFSWLSQPIYKVLALIVSNIFYTIPIAVGFFTMWYVFQNAPANWIVILKGTALYVVCVVFIMHTYETVFLIKSWETDKTKGDAIEKAKAKAELEALKNQIDPHFMFNSLNTLSYLIEKQPDKARLFNDALADVFRYILYNKDRELVLLSEEIDFAEKYFSLIRIRFGSGVVLHGVSRDVNTDDYLLPPISLQVLIENAIKHNAFSDRQPLTITMSIHDGSLILTNAIRPKILERPSSGIGLKNLSERYRLITGKEIMIDTANQCFCVRLPLLTATTAR